MTIRTRKNDERKIEYYFNNLVTEGNVPPTKVSGVTKKTIEQALSRIDRNGRDFVDVIFALMDNSFPNLFNSKMNLSDGASIAHLGCYIGIFIRHSNKLDREGRDYWIKPFVDIGIIDQITYDSESKTFVSGHIKSKSPNSAYRLNNEFVSLLQNFTAEAFDKFFSKNKLAIRLKLQTEAALSSVKKYGHGDHHKLIEFAIKSYVPHFLPEYDVVYIDNSDGDRVSKAQKTALEKIGLKLTIDDAFPDIVLISKDLKTLWFIEAVTSDGEVDLKKVKNLTDFCTKNKKQMGGMTTAYPNWKTAAARQGRYKNIAPETYIWIAEDPSKEFFATSMN